MLRASHASATPPFDDFYSFRRDNDVGWQFDVPPKDNANFAWVQHFIHHLARQGMAGFVLAQITANFHQSRTLATLRDTLLPKLLSGELSVKGDH